MPLASQGTDMMDVDEPFAELPVNRPKVASAYRTRMPVDRQAGGPQHWITLVDGQQPQDLSSL
jgi:hypothetical protein